MTVKIEKIAVVSELGAKNKSGAMLQPEFVAALKELKPGYSFVVPGYGSNHRSAISIAQYWSGFVFAVRKQDDGTYRVGRVS